PSTDTWIALPFGPSKRAGQSAVWTGSEMIIWGGSFTVFDTIHVRTSTVVLNTCSRYEPARNTWTPTLTDATSPSARTGHVGLWTGGEMIIWGGQEFLGTQGYRYIPSSDSWTVIADV